MDQVIVWLLNHRVLLGRLTVLATVIPFFLASIPLLTLPMLLAGIMLFLTLNWSTIYRYWQKILTSHFWMKLQYFWFTVGLVIFSSLLFVNLVQFVGLHYLVAGFYLIVYVIWFNKINSKLTEEQRRLIFKGDTTETSSSKDFEPYLIPLIFTLMIVFVISALMSMVQTRARSIFTIETIYWYFPLVVMIVHFLVDLVVVEQIEWYPEGGTTSWKSQELDQDLPDVRQPLALTQYFIEAAKQNTPPAEVKPFIEDNLEYLVREAQKLSYFPFQLNYVRCMENWGREGRDQIHLMFAIILASISQYRFIGLIPLYKRKMFYQGLQTIAMTGSMTQKWRELIEFEVIEKKDEHFVLDWVLGSRFLDFKYDPDWMIVWEGTIYKGKAGYYEAVQKMENLLQIRPDMVQWELDMWDLSFDYSKVFIGEDARELFSENIKFYDQLLFLAAKKTTEDYKREQEQYEQSLLNPSDRLVAVDNPKPKRNWSDDEKTDIIDSYLSNEPRTSSNPSVVSSYQYVITSFIQKLRGIELSTVLKLLGIILIFVCNLALVYYLDLFIPGRIGVIVVALEVVSLFILSITPTETNINLDDDMQTSFAVVSATSSRQASSSAKSADIYKGLLFLLYGVILLITYRLFLL